MSFLCRSDIISFVTIEKSPQCRRWRRIGNQVKVLSEPVTVSEGSVIRSIASDCVWMSDKPFMVVSHAYCYHTAKDVRRDERQCFTSQETCWGDVRKRLPGSGVLERKLRGTPALFFMPETENNCSGFFIDLWYLRRLYLYRVRNT